MKLVSEAVTAVVYSKAEAGDTTAEEADADEEEDTMVAVDVEANMAEAVGIIQLAGVADQMKEWCSEMMAHR